MTPHPIILCGRTEAIGTVVIENLKPEFESASPALHIALTTKQADDIAIAFVQTVESGTIVIPALLSGKEIASDVPLSQLGTRDYTKTPVAVVLGAAFDNRGIAELRTAASVEGARDVTWLRPDAGVDMPPPGPEYGMLMVERIKKRVRELEGTGELGRGGVVWF